MNNLLVLDPKWNFMVSALRLVAGYASSGKCQYLKKWGKTNVFQVPVEGEKPFVKAKDVPATKGKTVPLQTPSEVQGV